MKLRHTVLPCVVSMWQTMFLILCIFLGLYRETGRTFQVSIYQYFKRRLINVICIWATECVNIDWGLIQMSAFSWIHNSNTSPRVRVIRINASSAVNGSSYLFLQSDEIESSEKCSDKEGSECLISSVASWNNVFSECISKNTNPPPACFLLSAQALCVYELIKPPNVTC